MNVIQRYLFVLFRPNPFQLRPKCGRSSRKPNAKLGRWDLSLCLHFSIQTFEGFLMAIICMSRMDNIFRGSWYFLFFSDGHLCQKSGDWETKGDFSQGLFFFKIPSSMSMSLRYISRSANRQYACTLIGVPVVYSRQPTVYDCCWIMIHCTGFKIAVDWVLSRSFWT